MRSTGRNSLLSLGDKYRIYILFVLVFGFMSLFAPRFFSQTNFTAVLNAISMNAAVAIGFRRNLPPTQRQSSRNGAEFSPSQWPVDRG